MRIHEASRLIHAGIVLCVMLLASACTEVNYLRDAQETFSETAATENELRFRLNEPAAGTAAPASVQSGYASVVHSLNSLDDRQVDKLKKDRLFGSVLVLKSMSYWRLGDHDKAIATAQEALALGADELGPRDRALMTAMPGLVRNDQAAQKLHSPADAGTPDSEAQREERYQSIVGLLNSAEVDIANARKKAPPDHDVQLYLVQVQLAADKNVNDACVAYASSPGGALDLAKDSQCKGLSGSTWGSVPRLDCRTYAHVQDLQELLGQSTPEASRVVAAWQRATGAPLSKPSICS